MFPAEYWVFGLVVLALFALIDWKFSVLLAMIAAGVLAILHARVDLGMSSHAITASVKESVLPGILGLLVVVLMPVIAKVAYQIYWVRKHTRAAQEQKPIQ